MKLRVAVIGTGAMARKHSRILTQNPRAHLTVICSTPRSVAVGLEFQDEYGFHRSEVEFEKVLQADDVDAVLICSPDETHCDFVIRALEAGKHVLCEKPLARSREEYEAIEKAVSRGRTVLQVGMNCRYRTPYSRPRELAKELGPLRFLRGTYLLNKIATVKGGRKGWWSESSEGSYFFLHANGVHILDLIRWFGGPVKSVFARAACHELEENFRADTFSLSMEFCSGALGELLISLAAFQPREVELQAWYERGTIRGDRFYRRIGDQILPDVEEIDISQPRLDLHLQFDDFFRAVAEKSEPMNSVVEALANFELIQAVERSIQQGRPVAVDEAVATL
jgi:myo-inositol 2-dehydrogenase / D-chiro-inositol 1-dehydrogenase